MHNPIVAILILLSMSVVAVSLFRRLKFPSILGYLAVGILVGPSIMGILENSKEVHHVAEYGVVFLLFTVGLEFSLPQLIAMKLTVIGLGGLQVLLCTLAAGGVALLFGSTWTDALIVGGIASMSSTAIVIKQLTEQLEINSRHGRNALGILIFQDLAVVPFLILLPLLQANADKALAGPLTIALLKALAVFTVLLAIGHWLLRPLFRWIANVKSTELFMLTVLLVTLAAAWSGNLAGLSPALGAFIAGMMLGETEFRHQIEANIRPFRDILLGLFFITVGMLLNLSIVYQYWHAVILIVLGLIALKLVVIAVISRLFRIPTGVAVRTALVLAQGGEFGFAIISQALPQQVLSSHIGQLMLAGTLISMLIAPFVIRYNGLIVKTLFRRSYMGMRERYRTEIDRVASRLQDHVIICGYGRVGQNIARILENENIPYIAMDVDPYVIQEASEAGEQVFYGDSTHRDLLRAAHIDNARVMVVAFDDVGSACRILEHAHELRRDIPVLIRTSDDVHFEKLLERGAAEVVPEKLEASLTLASHLLHILEIPHDEIHKRLKAVRADQYLLLRSFFHGSTPGSIELDAAQRKRLQSVSLGAHASAIGKKLQDLDFKSMDISVTAIRRNQRKISQPEADMVLCAEDVLVLFGKPEDLERAEALLLS